MDPKTFKTMRRRYGFRQYEVAQAAKVIPSQLSAWERGYREFSPEAMGRVQRALQRLIRKRGADTARDESVLAGPAASAPSPAA